MARQKRTEEDNPNKKERLTSPIQIDTELVRMMNMICQYYDLTITYNGATEMTRYQPALKFAYLAPQYRGHPQAREFESCLVTILDWFPTDFDGWGWDQPIPDRDEWEEVVSAYNRQLMASC